MASVAAVYVKLDTSTTYCRVLGIAPFKILNIMTCDDPWCNMFSRILSVLQFLENPETWIHPSIQTVGEEEKCQGLSCQRKLLIINVVSYY